MKKENDYSYSIDSFDFLLMVLAWGGFQTGIWAPLIAFTVIYTFVISMKN